jgi:hypothetical protein
VERVESGARYQLEMYDGKRLACTIANIATDQNPNRDFRIEDAGMGLDYYWFRFNAYELHASLQVYTGISDSGHVRTNLNPSCSINFSHEFDLRVNLWDKFDISPRSRHAGMSSA